MRYVPKDQLPMDILPLGMDDLPFALLENQRAKVMKRVGKKELSEEEQTRIRMLVAIRDSEFGGVQVRMAEKLETAPDYLSRVLLGTKGLSGDQARVWEDRLDKPKYYLDGEAKTEPAKKLAVVRRAGQDQPDSEVVSLDDAMELLALLQQTDSLGRKRLLTLAKSLAKRGKVRWKKIV